MSSRAARSPTCSSLKIHLETEDGWLRLSKGGAKSLDCEFTVLDGEYAKRKIWALLTMDGPTPGHAVAADISRKTVRAMLESARGIRPDDKSAEAEKARLISDWGDLNGLCCVMRVGVKPAEGEYRAKNTIREIITPERQGWHQLEQLPAPSPKGGNGATKDASSSTSTAMSAKASPAAGVPSRPAWAKP